MRSEDVGRICILSKLSEMRTEDVGRFVCWKSTKREDDCSYIEGELPWKKPVRLKHGSKPKA